VLLELIEGADLGGVVMGCCKCPSHTGGHACECYCSTVDGSCMGHCPTLCGCRNLLPVPTPRG